jgi:UDP-3-O-[3-hydroxymyristoyl] N-acetylglucosamine deacetylase
VTPLSGLGLHQGKQSTVGFMAAPGPIAFERGGVVRELGVFRVGTTRRATDIACDAFTVSTVEHLLAGFAGLGLRSGCRVVLGGHDELPLLDGSAMTYARALLALELPTSPPSLAVSRPGLVEVDGSTYDFQPADGVHVSVDVDLPASCAPQASWDGHVQSFMGIASARTFALEEDVAELNRLGLARHVDPASALVVSESTIHGSGVVLPDEPARHKLLDLLGDAYLYGGPPRGRLHATRPGHARNHRAFERAIAQGILVKDAR